MSFEFPKRVPGSGYGLHIDEYHYQLMRNWGPDYGELIVPLSLYAFNRLSPSDQQEQLEEIHSHHEKSDFAELFKELNYSDQVKFLSKVLQKFKCERLIPSFKQLDAEHQQEVIEQMALVNPSRYRLLHPRAVTPKNLLRDPEETEEDFRLRRFTQLCTDRNQAAHKLIVARKHEQEKTSNDEEYNSDWKSGFYEFFLRFSVIWFQGQWASGQDMLIEQLSNNIPGTVIEKRQHNQPEEDFKLRRFTQLCTKLVDFRVQEKFLENAEQKLETYDRSSFLEPQGYEDATKLLSDLSTLGFSLLSAKHQHQTIERMSNLVGERSRRGLLNLVRHCLSKEAIRMKRFEVLFNQVHVSTRVDLFREMRNLLLKQRRYSEAVHFFKELDGKEQKELIKMLACATKRHKMIVKLVHKIGEKLCGNQRDLRLRRFKKVCMEHISTWGDILWPEADEERVQQGTSDINEEKSPYAEFLFEVSITWFKARCYNYQRNPIHVILSGKIEVTEKLPDESEEDFRCRRFTESFKRLQCNSQEGIVNYIQDGLFEDLNHAVPTCDLLCSKSPAEGRCSFDSEWIKIKLPNLQGQGAAATTPQVVSAGGSATTTQVGGTVDPR